MHRFFPRHHPVRLGSFAPLLLATLTACSGHERGTGPLDGGSALDDDASASLPDEGDGDGGSGRGGASDGGNPLSVGPGSDLCGLATLPLQPLGCACEPGAKVGCWTGTPGDRGRGECHDGVQTCEGDGEFGNWGPCLGEVQECGEYDAGVPPTDECGCVPGTIITCSEDCSELIICSLTGTKVCQPDGTWSRCREGNLDNLVNTNLCRNVFFGCLANQFQGVFVGACDDAFTCGHPPGLFPPYPPEGPGNGGDAGTGGDSGTPVIR